MPQMLAFVNIFPLYPVSAPVCVPAPTINGEGTGGLCTAFLYKNRKITAPKTKRFKRAFPFVLRGLVIFGYVGAVSLGISKHSLRPLTSLNSSCKEIASGFGHLLVSEWENVIEYLASTEK